MEMRLGAVQPGKAAPRADFFKRAAMPLVLGIARQFRYRSEGAFERKGQELDKNAAAAARIRAYSSISYIGKDTPDIFSECREVSVKFQDSQEAFRIVYEKVGAIFLPIKTEKTDAEGFFGIRAGSSTSNGIRVKYFEIPHELRALARKAIRGYTPDAQAVREAEKRGWERRQYFYRREKHPIISNLINRLTFRFKYGMVAEKLWENPFTHLEGSIALAEVTQCEEEGMRGKAMRISELTVLAKFNGSDTAYSLVFIPSVAKEAEPLILFPVKATRIKCENFGMLTFMTDEQAPIHVSDVPFELRKLADEAVRLFSNQDKLDRGIRYMHIAKDEPYHFAVYLKPRSK
jgi:hypothetical protein